jgi:hypothetical protein
MKLSRRTLLALAGAGTVLAQTPAPPPAAPLDPVDKARQENRHSAETLAQFAIPMSTEPAFTFRA